MYIRPSVSARTHLRQSQGTSFTRQAPGRARHGTHTRHCPARDSRCIFTRPVGQGSSQLGTGQDQGGAIGCPWVGGSRAACDRQMWTDAGCERREWPPGVQHEMCVRGHSCEMTHETCVGTCPCGVHVPESRGRPPSGCGPQSRRLGAEPLKHAPTWQAQKCLHKGPAQAGALGLRPEPSVCARAMCVRPPARGRRRGSTTHIYTHRWAGLSPAPGTVHPGPWGQVAVPAWPGRPWKGGSVGRV